MAHILVVNAGKALGFSKGELNAYLTQVAVETLTAMGHELKTTVIDEGYDAQEEVNKYVWADAVIYQQPAWWMGGPWILKKYIDDVFSAGTGILYKDDGRTRSNPDKKYGSGGVVHSKKYMISATWNAPQEAFDDPQQFFEGVGVDGVYLPFHKANQFLGMQPLPTFVCVDVMKAPHIEEDVARYKKHLAAAFPS